MSFVIPCIDILDGNCVQLIGGKSETATIYGSPEEWLVRWKNMGADLVHVIDLDAVTGTGSNKEIILKLLESKLVQIQVGGGIRDIEYAEELINKGAERVIIGSKALDIGFLEELNKSIPRQKIMAALDTRFGKVVVNGWQKSSDLTFSTAFGMIKTNVGSILSTDVNREGLMNGPDRDILRMIQGHGIPTYASGGFTNKEDIELAKIMGFAGVVIGRSIFTRHLDPEELW